MEGIFDALWQNWCRLESILNEMTQFYYHPGIHYRERLPKCGLPLLSAPMMTLRLPILCVLFLLTAAAGLIQCKKEDSPSGASGTREASITAPPPQKQSVLAEANPKVDFATKLPASTEFFLGTSDLKTHLGALKKSAFWKDVDALFNDKMPAPSAGDKSLSAAQKLWGDDFFIVGGAGFAEAALSLRDLSRLGTEMNFHALIPGTTAKSSGAQSSAPLKMLDTLLKDADMLGRAEAITAKLVAPPLMIGIKVEKPEELLKQLIPEAALKDAAKMGTVSDFTTSDGFAFKVIEFDGRKLIADTDRLDFVASLPSETTPEIRNLADKLLLNVQSRKITVAFGVVGDHIIFACGKNLDHLKFVPTAEQSLLSKPELAQLTPYSAKSLLGILYADAGVMRAMSNDQPFVPMVRGIVSGMKGSDMFRETAQKLIGQVDELVMLEKKAHSRECTALAAAVWWDKGLHAEMFGGAKPSYFRSGRPLQFASLLNKPGVLFGMAFNRDEQHGKITRAWVEKLTGMIYTAAQELLQAGMAGKDGGQQFAMFEKNFRPAFDKLYQGDKELSEKALGGQTAYVIDMNGKLPDMPDMPKNTKGTTIPRIYIVSEVADRMQITKSWEAMSAAIAKASASTSSDAGLPGFTLSEPRSSDKNGVTTYFYGLPYFAGDVLPCASVNDKLLILSSSKEGAEAIAADIAKAPPAALEGSVWKLDFGLVSTLIKTTTTLRGGVDAAGNDEMKQTMKWLKPFHVLQGHTYEEAGRLRGSISWEIKDVLTFD